MHRRLDNNQLYGQVPEAIYTIGVHGGFINLSSNLGLCGVPSLPDCPHAWNGGGSSTGATIGIVIGCSLFALFVGLGVLLYLQRKGSQEDYNFNLPHQLVGKALLFISASIDLFVQLAVGLDCNSFRTSTSSSYPFSPLSVIYVSLTSV